MSITDTGPQGVIASFTYTRDATGRTLTEQDADGRHVQYTYDANGWLTGEAISAPGQTPRTTQYSYDAVGNRVQIVDSLTGVEVLTYDPDDRLMATIANGETTTYVYDSDGNLLSQTTGPGTSTTYTWDLQNRLTGGDVTAGGTTTHVAFVYDATGELLQRSDAQGTVRYLVDPRGSVSQVLEEYLAGGTLLASYTYGLALISQARGSTTSYYHTDWRLAASGS